MAASSLATAMPVLAARFEDRSGTDVDVVLAATGSLAAQIEHGAPGDVFLSADRVTVERLADEGLLREPTMADYAEGRLALVWRERVSRPETVGELAEATYVTVALANPEHAPYGIAAREALERAGVLEIMEPRLVLGENVVQAHQLVRTGNADAGIVARSVVEASSSDFVPVDPALHAPIRQAAALLEGSRHPAAGDFLDFVLGPEGREILSEHGFAPPGNGAIGPGPAPAGRAS